MGASPSTTALLESAARPRRWSGASWLLALGLGLLALAFGLERHALFGRDDVHARAGRAEERLSRAAALRAEMVRLAEAPSTPASLASRARLHAERAAELGRLLQEQAQGPEGALAGLPGRTADQLARVEQEALERVRLGDADGAGRLLENDAYLTAQRDFEAARAAAVAALEGWAAESERAWSAGAQRRLFLAGAGLGLALLGTLASVLGLRAFAHLDRDLAAKTRDLAGFGNRLKQLHRLANSQYGSTEALLRDHLQTGCTVLEMELGAFGPPPGTPGPAALETRRPLPAGDELALRQALLRAPLDARATLAFPGEQALPDELLRALAHHELQSYLGARVQAGETAFGALAFAAGAARGSRAFTRRDVELIELLASGLGARLGELTRTQERERAAAALSEAARLRSEFLAITSHELRTPLNAVIGMSGVLLDTPLSLEQREHAETIRAGGHMLLDLINDVLDLSKLEAGQLELQQVDFDLRELVEELLDMLGPLALARGLELVGHVSPELPARLRGDPARLRQVLVNLCANALRFTPSGHVVVRVTPQARQALDLRFEVEDTGVGIPLEHQARLFQPYAQVAADARGTGLGLSISKRLVEKMGGQIGVRSLPGRGSTFWFSLRAQPATSALEAAAVRPLEGLQILVAEPNAACRAMLHDVLEAAGAKVLAHADLSGAEEALRARPGAFRFVLLDALLAEGRAEPLLADAQGGQLVLLTPGSSADPDLARRLGASVSVAKPLRASRLVERLKRLVQVPGEPSLTPAEAHAGEPPRILLVEDDPVNQRVALSQLQQLGRRADVVASGRAALQAVSRGSYGLVLMDCRVPDLDGLEVTRRLRQLPGELSRVAVVALTAGGQDGERRACLEAGMDDYLTKPLRRAELERTLQRWLPAQAPPAPDVHSAALEALFDVERVRLLRSAGPGFLEQVLGLALSTMPEQLAALQQAAAEQDAERLEFLAHTLKSRWLNLGATRLAGLLAVLEERARAGQLDDASARSAELQDEFLRLSAALPRPRP